MQAFERHRVLHLFSYYKWVCFSNVVKNIFSFLAWTNYKECIIRMFSCWREVLVELYAAVWVNMNWPSSLESPGNISACVACVCPRGTSTKLLMISFSGRRARDLRAPDDKWLGLCHVNRWTFCTLLLSDLRTVRWAGRRRAVCFELVSFSEPPEKQRYNPWTGHLVFDTGYIKRLFEEFDININLLDPVFLNYGFSSHVLQMF